MMRITCGGMLLASLVGMSLVWAQPEDVLVIAHRGASGYLPEHTLEAKVLAFAQGADYIEQDLVMTRDDQLVVFHDLTLERMTDVETRFPGRARDDGSYYVVDFDLNEIRELALSEAGSYAGRFPASADFFRIHTFAEELALVQGLAASTGREAGIYPELKSPWFHHREGKDLASAVLLELQAHGYHQAGASVFVQSFDYQELRRVREELFPLLGFELPLVQLIARNEWQETMVRSSDNSWTDYDYSWMSTLAGMQQLAALVQGVGMPYDLLTDMPELVTWAQDNGMLVHPYTLRADDPRLDSLGQSFDELLEQLVLHLGVDGVFTDHPDKVRAFVVQDRE